MPYTSNFIARIKTQPVNLIGTRLALWAIYHDISATKLAMAIGATRQSVYNWMKGGGVLHVYEDRLQRLLHCMQNSKTTDEAWKRICKEFNLRA
jgi:predicted DNA-binding protein YlxM (UPF0122 family)